MKRRRKYPRHCCKRCKIMHHSYASAEKHKATLGGKSRPKRRKKGGFASMSAKKRSAIARKGGLASARARGHR